MNCSPNSLKAGLYREHFKCNSGGYQEFRL